VNTHTLSSEAPPTTPPPPQELKGWNWGAFGLTWIWGLAHRTYFALLVFVPLLGWFAVPIVLGLKGNSWAYRNRSWRSIDEFRATQRNWARYALTAWACAAASALILMFVTDRALKSSGAFEGALAHLIADPLVATRVGLPLSTGRVGGDIRVVSGTGSAQLDFPVSGPKGSGHVYVSAARELGLWSIVQLDLVLADGSRLALLHPIADMATPASSTVATDAAASQPSAADAPAQTAPAAEPIRIADAGPLSVRDAPSKPLREAWEQQRPGLGVCFYAAAPSTETRFTLKLRLKPDGKVQRAKLNAAPGALDAHTTECVLRQARSWSFPSPHAGAHVVLAQKLKAQSLAPERRP